MTPRPYRFPPLAQVAARAALPPQDLQAALAGGYQEGQQRGYHEGHVLGLRRGHDEGLAAAQAEGLRSGRQQALREVREHFDGLAAPVDALLAALRQAQDEYQQALRKELVDLVARVSRQVIRCELALQPVQLLALVDETLAAMPAPHKGVEVHLNGDDLARILEVDPVRAGRWSLLADPQLEPGECRVKTDRREADAGCRQRLAACMEQVSAQLLEPEAVVAATDNRAATAAIAGMAEPAAPAIASAAGVTDEPSTGPVVASVAAGATQRVRGAGNANANVGVDTNAQPPAAADKAAPPVERRSRSRSGSGPATDARAAASANADADANPNANASPNASAPVVPRTRAKPSVARGAARSKEPA